MEKCYVYENAICVRAADFLESGLSDSDSIEAAIAYAKENHIPTILIDKKDWILDRAILVYSGATFIVDGVMLKQADGVFDNLIRSEGFIVDPENPYGYPLDVVTVENVRLIGKNGAKIEGPEVQPKIKNLDTGELVEPYGDVWGWRGISVYLTCIRNFEFSGFTVTKTRTWAISFERAKDGVIRDLEIYSSECPNGDGLNFRNGCCRIAIQRIKGTTSDDFIAINNCSLYNENYPVRSWKTYFYPIVASNMLMKNETLEDQHIHDIFISDICSNSAVMFLPRNGHKIFRIWARNLNDGAGLYKRRNIAHVVGAYYGTGYGDISKETCLSDIYIDNVTAGATQSAVLFRDNVKNLFINNVKQNTPDGTVLTAIDEDDIVMKNCEAVSGCMRRSAKDWVNPMLIKDPK